MIIHEEIVKNANDKQKKKPSCHTVVKIDEI